MWCDVVRVSGETCYHNNLSLENVEHCGASLNELIQDYVTDE